MGPSEQPQWLTTEEQEAWRAIAQLLLRLPRPLDAQLQRDCGITLFEYFVLSWLSMAPEHRLPMTQLAELANGSLSRLSNVAKRLEARGWLTRCADPNDGRTTIAALTDAGWGVVAEAAPGHVAAVRRFVIDPLTADQLGQLSAIGHRLADAMAGPAE